MHNAVLVVVANARYLDPAKSLFFAAKHTGQWAHDMVLVACPDVQEEHAAWFVERGVEVMHFDPPVSTVGLEVAQAAQFHKLNVFRAEFKKWQRVVYLDCDILLLRSLAPLLALDTESKIVVDGEVWPDGLASQFDFTPAPHLRKTLEHEVTDLSKPNFNTSSMVFETDLVMENTYEKMVDILQRYQPILKNGDQPVINIHFDMRWKQLPSGTISFFQADGAADNIGLHFCNWNAPWALEGTNIQEIWRSNLNGANAAKTIVDQACP